MLLDWDGADSDERGIVADEFTVVMCDRVCSRSMARDTGLVHYYLSAGERKIVKIVPRPVQ